MDAYNAFNSINRAAMLENIKRLCPIAYIYAYNSYSVHARLFFRGGKEVFFKEGTTQGAVTAMAFDGIGLLPLIWLLHTSDDPARQAAFADELNGGGKLGKYGYNAEPTKFWLVVKDTL